jgi:hypothetical protein
MQPPLYMILHVHALHSALQIHASEPLKRGLCKALSVSKSGKALTSDSFKCDLLSRLKRKVQEHENTFDRWALSLLYLPAAASTRSRVPAYLNTFPNHSLTLATSINDHCTRETCFNVCLTLAESAHA